MEAASKMYAAFGSLMITCQDKPCTIGFWSLNAHTQLLPNSSILILQQPYIRPRDKETYRNHGCRKVSSASPCDPFPAMLDEFEAAAVDGGAKIHIYGEN